MYNECTGCNFVCILHPYCNVYNKDLKEKEVFNFNERIVEKFFMGLKWMMLEVSLALHLQMIFIMLSIYQICRIKYDMHINTHLA